jgi:hypothetical protein
VVDCTVACSDVSDSACRLEGACLGECELHCACAHSTLTTNAQLLRCWPLHRIGAIQLESEMAKMNARATHAPHRCARSDDP